MKKETALKVAELMTEIQALEKTIKHFDKVCNFTKIRIEGEDGSERSYHVSIDDFNLAENICEYAIGLHIDKRNELLEKLESL